MARRALDEPHQPRAGIDRKTVRNYISEAKEAGLSAEKPLPERQALLTVPYPLVPHLDRPKPSGGQFEDHRVEIIEFLTQQRDPLKPKTAYEVICHQHEITASYSNFKRFIRRLAPELSAQRTTCRIEVEPGMEIQIDYAKMGVLNDPVTGRNRTVYAFLATQSHSRYKFVEFVYTQNQRSFVASHVRMFSLSWGTATCLIIGNLKSGVLKPDHYDPELNLPGVGRALRHLYRYGPGAPSHTQRGKLSAWFRWCGSCSGS